MNTLKGEGVGKTNKGIALPVKASLKFNTNGVINLINLYSNLSLNEKNFYELNIFEFKVGYNLADQFTVNWWDHLFNETASKIKPKKNEDNFDEIPKVEVKI